jgi:hypothetical protein
VRRFSPIGNASKSPRDLPTELGHHPTDFFPDFLNKVFFVSFGKRGEYRPVDHILKHPFAGKLAGLDIFKNFLHRFIGFRPDDTGAAGKVAILRRVADLLAHVG